MGGGRGGSPAAGRSVHAQQRHPSIQLHPHPTPHALPKVFRLNWAAYGVGKAASGGSEDCASLFVGDLAPDVSDLILQEYFRQFYPSVRSAKVITDAATGRSKGYGFVRFGSEGERDRALTEMAGHFLSNRPIRVSLATAKKHSGAATGATAAQAPHPSGASFALLPVPPCHPHAASPPPPPAPPPNHAIPRPPTQTLTPPTPRSSSAG